MKATSKKIVKKVLKDGRKLAAKNRHTRKAAILVKKALLTAIGTSSAEREIYELKKFYPSIIEYHAQQQDQLKTDPLISILLPTYNTPEDFLRECIESIIIQSYPKWELCIADDKSPDDSVVKIIKEYQKKDARIKLVERKRNGHISEATNSALKIATGDYIALMDHDDVLWPNALYEIVRVIRKDKAVDFIYTDEDKIDGTGKIHSYPFLKPDFSPEFLESCNYITHFSCIRAEVMKQVGGPRKGYEGAQDWDLFIRIAEITDKIVHIPKILYSWRIHEASTASDTDAKPYVYEAQKKLLVDHLERSGRKGVVETGIIPQHRTIKYDLENNEYALLIVHYSNEDNLTLFAKSMKNFPSGTAYRVLIVHESDGDIVRTTAEKAFEPGEQLSYGQIESGKDFLPQIMDMAEGGPLIFVKDTVEIASDAWVKLLAADTQLNNVGVVGPVLLAEDRLTIRSAGVGLNYGKSGALDMLEGTPFDDPHYTRGLYAKSRRNVSAVNPALFAVSSKAVALYNGESSLVAFCYSLLGQGLRHIYTPYVQAILIEPGTVQHFESNNTEDRYLNPNFNHDNPRMEVES